MAFFCALRNYFSVLCLTLFISRSRITRPYFTVISFFVFLSHLLLQVLFDLGVYMHQVSIVVDLHIPRVFHNCQTLGVALEKSFRFVEIWPVVRLIISYGFGAVVRVLRDLRKVVLCAKRHLHRVFIDRNFI